MNANINDVAFSEKVAHTLLDMLRK
jgi:hypothetical protein